ncbi:MAG TPA: hypothetical protein DC047_15395 [Blastocatellia bacterium]|nr:hypothetical protein [Blastocatellia bacterium]
MKRTILTISLTLVCGLAINAQTANTSARGDASNQTSAAAQAANKSINLDSGTRLAGELQSTIDARKAKVGDQVVLKTTQAIKSQGRTVVGKGSRLVGHVTEVSQKSKSSGESRVGLLFDRLEGGSLNMPIAATITSVVNSTANARAGNDDLFADAGSSTSSRSSAGSSRSSSSGNSSLLGGAVSSTTSTVGNVVGGTTSALGSTVDSTTNVVGNTTTGVGRSLGGIQISQSSNTSVEGSSVLSLQGGNLRLEKGTTFNLMLTQSASAGTTRQ